MPDKLQWIETVAKWMDSKYRIPGTRFRFGLDPILSLFPALGNIVSYIVSAFLVVHMVRYGASGMVVVKMVLNICLDFLISNVPVLGTIITAGYKANNRNVRLLKEHHGEGKHQGSGLPFILGVVGMLLLISLLFLLLVLYLVVLLISRLGEVL